MLGAVLLTVSMVALAILGRVQKVTVLCYQPVRRSAIQPAPARNVIQVQPTEIKVIER